MIVESSGAQPQIVVLLNVTEESKRQWCRVQTAGDVPNASSCHSQTIAPLSRPFFVLSFYTKLYSTTFSFLLVSICGFTNVRQTETVGGCLCVIAVQGINNEDIPAVLVEREELVTREGKGTSCKYFRLKVVASD